MSIFSVFYKPNKAVSAALSNPNLGLGTLLVLIYCVVSYLPYIYLGFAFDAYKFLLSIIFTLAGWILVSVIFYLIMAIIRGKSSKFVQGPASFSGIMTAVSLVYLFFIVGGLVSVIAATSFSPQFVSVAKISMEEGFNIQDTTKLTGIVSEKNTEELETFANDKMLDVEKKDSLLQAMNYEGNILGNANMLFWSVLLSLALMILGFLFVFYPITSNLVKLGFLGNLIIFIIAIVVFSYLGNLLINVFA
ncbi:MAG: hypothetical protein AABW72_00780 [archaeon]